MDTSNLNCTRLGSRDQKPWATRKRGAGRGFPFTVEMLHSMIQDPDLADELAEMNLGEGIRHQLKRRRIMADKADKADETKQGGGRPPAAGEEWMPPNEFGVVLKAPFRLYPHQIEAVLWYLKSEQLCAKGVAGGVLSVEMGLGKTLISMVSCMSTYQAGQCATLVVMPKTLMTNYVLDASKFFGDSVRALMWDRSVLGPVFFDFSTQTPFKNHFVVVSYNTVLALAKSLNIIRKSRSCNAKLAGVARAFYQTPWTRVVCDESHTFANHDSQLWEALMQLHPGRRMCLTGTAVRNYEDDLFAQLKFCGLNILPSSREWTIQNYKLHGLRSLVYCKGVADCEIDLPEKEEIRQFVTLSEFEKQVYNILMGASTKALVDFKNKSGGFANVLEMFMRLRQACVAPHLIAPESKCKKLTKREVERSMPGGILGTAHQELEEMVRLPDGPSGHGSAKMTEMLRIARSIPDTEKMLVFCEWSTASRMAARVLGGAFGDEAVETVDGDTKDKDAAFSRFKLRPEVRFLCCTAVATHGLTLTEANHALTLSTTWTGTTIEQFYARIWRIGQTKKCFMWQLIVKGSIESRMLDICAAKHSVRDELLNQGVNADIMSDFLGGGELA